MHKIIKKVLDRWVWYSEKKRQSIPPSTTHLLWEDAAKESVSFIKQHLTSAMVFHDKRQLWNFALNEAGEDGLHIECGVFNGTSINYFARKKSNVNFYGFDSFEGLEENWTGHHKTKGSFDLKGELPKVEGNVSLIKGWLNDTYAPFLKKESKKISFLHIDTDTYSPAATILKESKPYLKRGSIILFDELIGYPNWKDGEFKALRETLGENEYEYIGFSNTQSAIKIL